MFSKFPGVLLYDGSRRRSGRGIFILHLFVLDEQFRDLLMLFRAPVDTIADITLF